MGVLPESVKDVTSAEQASLLPTNKLLSVNNEMQPPNHEKYDSQLDAQNVSWLQSFSVHTFVGALSVLIYIIMAIQGQR